MKLAFYVASQGNWLDKLIGWKDGARFSHVELVFSDGMSFSSSPRDGGVRYKSIEFDAGKWEFLVVLASPEQEQLVRRWCDGKVGKSYDWCGVFGFLLPFIKQRQEWWFCSEICTAALQQIGWLEKVVPGKTSPAGLYQHLTGLWPE